MSYMPPRVSAPHSTHVGVCVLWADDLTYCRARYLDWNVRIDVALFDAINPEFRKAIEGEAYRLAIEPFQ